MLTGILIGVLVGIAIEIVLAKLWGKYKISALLHKEKAYLEAKLEAIKKIL